MNLGFLQRLAAKYLGPKLLAGFLTSTIAFVTGWLSGSLPDAPAESVEQVSTGLNQLLIGLGGLLFAYTIDFKTAKAWLDYFKDKKPEQPEIVKED